MNLNHDSLQTYHTNSEHRLTLILGPVKQIIERTKETKTKEDLSLVQRNANKLLGLVNQLLDISKIESGNMKLQTISNKYYSISESSCFVIYILC